MKPQSEKYEYGEPFTVSIDKIRLCNLQPRRHFDPERLGELAASFKQNGWDQPIVVSFDVVSGFYEIIAGERRWQAAQLAGLREIEVVIRQPPQTNRSPDSDAT